MCVGGGGGWWWGGGGGGGEVADVCKLGNHIL